MVLEVDPGAIDSSGIVKSLKMQPAGKPWAGDFELLNCIEQGGKGVVDGARQLSLNRWVALKMIRASRSARKHERERFFREATAVAGLRHPDVVTVYGVGPAESI
jgi:serine/threonine protein kinase